MGKIYSRAEVILDWLESSVWPIFMGTGNCSYPWLQVFLGTVLAHLCFFQKFLGESGRCTNNWGMHSNMRIPLYKRYFMSNGTSSSGQSIQLQQRNSLEAWWKRPSNLGWHNLEASRYGEVRCMQNQHKSRMSLWYFSYTLFCNQITVLNHCVHSDGKKYSLTRWSPHKWSPVLIFDL